MHKFWNTKQEHLEKKIPSLKFNNKTTHEKGKYNNTIRNIHCISKITHGLKIEEQKYIN